MSTLIKGFITRDDYSSHADSLVTEVYDLSSIGATYSKTKETRYSTEDPIYGLHIFKSEIIGGASNNIVHIPQSTVDNIIRVVSSFVTFLSNTTSNNRNTIIISFNDYYNNLYTSTNLNLHNYNNVISYQSIKVPDYLYFTLDGDEVEIWLSDDTFRTFYPNYQIDIVLPFDDLPSIVNNQVLMTDRLNNFSIVEFNRRIEEAKGNLPNTVTRVINIPYILPSDSGSLDCYFAFNIYGAQGDYEDILKLKLMEYLTDTLGMDTATVLTYFPSINNINQFFSVPLWDKFAIPSNIGVNGINSQVTKTYNNPFDITTFLGDIYEGNTQYLLDNTYSVPLTYNNILNTISNGLHTEEEVRDFIELYPDIINVPSTHPDFSRMKTETQEVVLLLHSMLEVSNADNNSLFFSNIINNTDRDFRLITLNDTYFLTIRHGVHQYYMLPKFEYIRLKGE